MSRCSSLIRTEPKERIPPCMRSHLPPGVYTPAPRVPPIQRQRWASFPHPDIWNGPKAGRWRAELMRGFYDRGTDSLGHVTRTSFAAQVASMQPRVGGYRLDGSHQLRRRVVLAQVLEK